MAVEVLKAKTKPTYKLLLSDIENVMAKMYIRFSFFFVNDDGSARFMPSAKLKLSLVETLDDFYELSGRLQTLENGSLVVDCNNEGIQWTEKTLDWTVVKDFPQQYLPENLLPVPKPDEGFLLKVELSRLKDQSVVLSVAIHHSVADAHGFFRFILCWASRANGRPLPQPYSNRMRLYGAKGSPSMNPPEFMVKRFSAEEIAAVTEKMRSRDEVSTGRVFRITAEAQEALKREVKMNQQQLGLASSRLSTNDALAALLWQASCRARAITGDKTVCLGIPSNGRSRLNPPLTDSYFGNATCPATARLPVNDLLCMENGYGLALATLEIRRAVDAMSSDRIASMLNWIASQPDKSLVVRSFDTMQDDFVVSNMTRFPMYETDFGYGRPKRIRPTSKHFDGTDMAVIFPGPPEFPESLEVTVGLPIDAMQRFCDDEYLCRFMTCIGYHSSSI